MITSLYSQLTLLQPLQLSLYTLIHTHHSHFVLLSCCLFIGKNGATSPALLQQWLLPTPTLFQQWWLPTFDILDGCNSSCCNSQWLLHINDNQPNNHPLCHSWIRMTSAWCNCDIIMHSSMQRMTSAWCNEDVSMPLTSQQARQHSGTPCHVISREPSQAELSRGTESRQTLLKKSWRWGTILAYK